MARRRAAKKEPAQRLVRLKASDLSKALVEDSRLITQSKFYGGERTTNTKEFLEKSNFGRKAYAVLQQMNRMDDLKRQDMMEMISMGFKMMGWDAQGKLFERVEQRMSDDVADESDPRPDFLKRADSERMDLGDAEKKFEAAAKANPPKGPTAGTKERVRGAGASAIDALGELGKAH